MSSLPPLKQVLASSAESDGPLAKTLSTLFEPSSVLTDILVPQLSSALTANETSRAVDSYGDLINAAMEIISRWDVPLRQRFIAGHPRIGETKNLSAHSAKEQGGPTTAPTPPEVLARLSHLNACYEKRYPGLIYVTFVAGRSRVQIAEEIEGVLGIEHSISPDQPAVGSIMSIDGASEEWKKELDRAVKDVGKIAKSRAQAATL